MAGKPPRGGSGMTYALIVFVALTVVSLAAFIWQFTLNEKIRKEAETAQNRMREFGQPPAYYLQEARARLTNVASVIERDFGDVAFLLVGQRDAVGPAILEQAKRLLEKVSQESPSTADQNDTVLTALLRQHRAHLDAQRESEGLKSEIEALKAERQSLADGLQTTRDEFVAEVEGLKAEIARLGQEKEGQLSAKDQQYQQEVAAKDALSEEYNRFKVTTRAKTDEFEVANERLRKQVSDLNEIVQDLKSGGFDPGAILTSADAHVVRAIPGSNVVYISAGHNDRLKPGLRFQVFSPTDEPTDDFLGKATIEVSHVSERTAECRVLRSTPGRPIVEDDVVINIAYEKNRLPRFVVRGTFDLDYDGIPDQEGTETVNAIIQEWGGQVVPQIDEQTDFVVLGHGPQAPALSLDRTVSSVIQAQADQAARERAEFDASIERARTLNIPIVTQPQFLRLMGFDR